jgi:hypothetical protein
VAVCFYNRHVRSLDHWVGLLRDYQKSSTNEIPRHSKLSRDSTTRNKGRSRRRSGDSAHAIVMAGAAENWHGQLLVTIARVKAFFGYSKGKQDELIKLSEY